MPTLTISHETWQRTRALAYLALGKGNTPVKELNFQQWLDLITRGDLADWEVVPELEITGEEWSGTVIHSYKVGERDQAHQPQVSEEIIDQVDQLIAQKHALPPLNGLQFEEKLKVGLNDIEEAMWKERCTIKREDSG